MTKENLIESFSGLGFIINNLNENDLESLYFKANAENPWITRESIELALKGIAKWLSIDVLSDWLSNYPDLPSNNPKNVGLILAGNIPLVGFHDVLSVLISGNKAITKLSTKDTVCMDYLRNELVNINSEFESLWIKTEFIKGIDAIIATGSDNSARYFNQYFSKYPHIIRKNRTSIAVLNGHESDDDIINLGKDVFTYFGLGCRNVTYLLLHDSIDPARILRIFEHFDYVKEHNKYMNNYEYYRSIYLVNQQMHYASDFLILKEGEELFTPVANINYRMYSELAQVNDFIEIHKDSIQCIVSNQNLTGKEISFGKTQDPDIFDYADGLDTLKYLESLE